MYKPRVRAGMYIPSIDERGIAQSNGRVGEAGVHESPPPPPQTNATRGFHKIRGYSKNSREVFDEPRNRLTHRRLPETESQRKHKTLTLTLNLTPAARENSRNGDVMMSKSGLPIILSKPGKVVNTSPLGASGVCLVGENPVPALLRCERLWSYDYSHA